MLAISFLHSCNDLVTDYRSLTLETGRPGFRSWLWRFQCWTLSKLATDFSFIKWQSWQRLSRRVTGGVSELISVKHLEWCLTQNQHDVDGKYQVGPLSLYFLSLWGFLNPPDFLNLLFKTFIFNWRIIALQCPVSICSTTMWISCKCTYIPSPRASIPTPYPWICF